MAVTVTIAVAIILVLAQLLLRRGPLAAQCESSPWLRPLLHADTMHLVTNMVAIVLICLVLEQRYGSTRLAIFIALSYVASVLVDMLWSGSSCSVGASGVVYALLAAVLLKGGVTWWSVVLLVLAVFQPYLMGERNTAHLAHLQGALIGVALLPIL